MQVTWFTNNSSYYVYLPLGSARVHQTLYSSHVSISVGSTPKLRGTMSLAEISSPVSSAYHLGTPSPTLSAKSLASRPLTSVTSATSLSRPISPVIKAAASSVVMTPLNLQQQQQENQQRQSNHVRSHSVPSLQLQPQPPRPVEHPVTTLVRDQIHSSSAANLLALRRESNFPSITYTTYFPKSPRLMPCMSPGAVTPMQLEEDLEYRFPSISNASIRHSPLIVPVSLEEENNEMETFLEIRVR